jgi:phenylacetate-coenzyme A ligase PaaK-like adenylate-forming protein
MNQDLLVYRTRCLEALDIALQRTPMYASWRPRDPGPSHDLDSRFAALPFLTKADIRAHFPDGVVPRGLDWKAALERGEISFVKTSGTAAEALTNIWNQAWWDASEAASWKLNAAAAAAATGSHREAILASALSVGPRSNGPTLDRKARTLGRFLFLNEYGSTLEWPVGHEKRMLAELAEFQPDVLEANPSLLARLARFIVASGAAVFQPKLITITYEFPSKLQLRVIKQAFSSPVVSSYGSTEAGYVFMECEHGLYHQNAEFCRVDMIPVGMDGIGRMMVTTFGNTWFPLLRFEIGDLGRVSHEPCPCGRSFGLTLSSIEGRLLSICQAADGAIVTHRQIDEAIAAAPGVSEYRVDQDAPGSLSVKIVSSGGMPGVAAREARDALHALFGSGMEISAEAVPVLAPEQSGKFLLVRRGIPLMEGAIHV